MMAEIDTVYRFVDFVVLTCYVDDDVVLWRQFDPKKQRFVSRVNRSTPRRYFENHARIITVSETIEQVKSAAAVIGVQTHT